jgi:hypothetical protein
LLDGGRSSYEVLPYFEVLTKPAGWSTTEVTAELDKTTIDRKVRKENMVRVVGYKATSVLLLHYVVLLDST